MRVTGALGATLVARTTKGTAVGGITTDTSSSAIAIAGILLSRAGAALVKADSGSIPIAARTTTIARTVIAAGRNQRLGTFIEGVRTVGDVHASTGTVTHLTKTALPFRVGGRSVFGTFTFDASHIAGLAGTRTPGVTAVAVNTLAAGALVVNGASLPIVLSSHASRAEAVGISTAIGVLGAGIAAVRAGPVALVRTARDGA